MGTITVEYSKLKGMVDTIDEYCTKVETHRTACTDAGNAAVQAGGGDTKVGEAIKSCIIDISNEQFDAVISVIKAFEQAVTDVAANYEAFDTNLTNSIDEIAAARRKKYEQQTQTAGTPAQ